MSDNLDKELDEIMGLMNNDHAGRSVSTQQSKTVAKRYVRSKQQPRYSLNENEKPNKGSKQCKQAKIRRWAIIGGIIAVIVLILVLLCKGCVGGDVLKGTWDMDGTTVYQFEGNGKGAMLLPSNTYTFKYTINEEEKTVSIDFDDERATDYTYSYTVDKDSLTLYGSVGKESFEYIFTKQDDK